MNFDFALLMFILLVVTGAIWGLDRLLWAPKRRGAGSRKEPMAVEYARAFFPVILIVFLLRSFLVEPFRIPSGSMLPTLLIGDFILVNKYTYGIRLPVVNAKVMDVGEPKRGDVMVFRFPGDPSVNYIKRVVGVPGDHIEYRNKELYINGQPERQSDPRPVQFYGEGDGAATRYTEDLDGVKHGILLTDSPDTPFDVVVPPGQFFVMGDNRDHSNDSRYWGFVPDKNIVGRAFLIWFSWDEERPVEWFWQHVVWNRIGTTIR
jgi:signal peptidase I